MEEKQRQRIKLVWVQTTRPRGVEQENTDEESNDRLQKETVEWCQKLIAPGEGQEDPCKPTAEVNEGAAAIGWRGPAEEAAHEEKRQYHTIVQELYHPIEKSRICLISRRQKLPGTLLSHQGRQDGPRSNAWVDLPPQIVQASHWARPPDQRGAQQHSGQEELPGRLCRGKERTLWHSWGGSEACQDQRGDHQAQCVHSEGDRRGEVCLWDRKEGL